jgi:hypothetical protein
MGVGTIPVGVFAIDHVGQPGELNVTTSKVAEAAFQTTLPAVKTPVMTLHVSIES